MKRTKKSRPLREEERELWTHVARTISPLHKEALPLPPSSEQITARALPSAPRLPFETKTAAKPLNKKKPAPHRAVMEAGDPRAAKKVARGRTQIDATIDLHGMRQLEAEMRLHRFLSTARDLNHRTVLVITGKGAPDGLYDPFEDAPRGILRRRFIEWVEQPNFRSMISSVRASHIRHGGSGAFYVFLRRARG